ncbi:MAG: Bcr/CflA family drug resistance efflux transporter [Ahrensia sp.]|nr:Bcr/CflA family drug resistance efflux transporter [Ahrensia sp.]|tara:strand:- start:11127 stop:12371 length:1245 start_codon:yes stop_codon:yes gene_type:complete
MTAPIMGVGRTALIATILVSVGPLSMALYTPAMPMLVEAFDTTHSVIKITLTAYFAGFALSQLAAGPFADALGRRRSTIIFIGVYILGSLAAVLAPTVEILIVARLVQGVGAAIGITVSRAIIRDLYTGERGARLFNLVAIAMASAPAFGPAIGGVTMRIAGWHAIFVLMVMFGFFIGGIAIFALRETIVPDVSRLRPLNILRAYKALAANAEFLTASIVIASATGMFYAQATLLPFVMMDAVGLTPTEFGFSMLFQSGTFMFGSLTMRLLLRWWTPSRLVVPGLCLIVAGSIGLATAPHLLGASLLTVMLPVAVSAFGVAYILPYMLMAGMRPFPHIAGQAAALTGFMQMGAGLLGGTIGAFFADPIWAISAVIPAMGLMSAAAFVLYRRASDKAQRLEADMQAAQVIPAPAE